MMVIWCDKMTSPIEYIEEARDQLLLNRAVLAFISLERALKEYKGRINITHNLVCMKCDERMILVSSYDKPSYNNTEFMCQTCKAKVQAIIGK